MHDNDRVYEGEFENDRKHGIGFERFANQSYYEGLYVNGKPEGNLNYIIGKGKFIWPNGEKYEG